MIKFELNYFFSNPALKAHLIVLTGLHISFLRVRYIHHSLKDPHLKETLVIAVVPTVFLPLRRQATASVYGICGSPGVTWPSWLGVESFLEVELTGVQCGMLRFLRLLLPFLPVENMSALEHFLPIQPAPHNISIPQSSIFEESAVLSLY